jgi:hypothetical protein
MLLVTEVPNLEVTVEEARAVVVAVAVESLFKAKELVLAHQVVLAVAEK